MILHTLLPTGTLWSIFFALLLLITTTSAHPYPQFAHSVRSLNINPLHPTFHLFPRFWTSTKAQEKRTPAPINRHLHRRGLPGAVYICTDANFRGHCAWTMPESRCHIPGTGDNAPESIGPDPDGFCVLFESTNCDGNQIRTLRFPGIESAVPEFGSIQCFADGQRGNATSTAANAKITGFADPRLPGGFGSADALALKSVLQDMENDGFSQGMIGLKKAHYY
ncbi:hypothetical protein DM02DRAFT_258571 [Periconia macrospinosa]|uniref:Uncharacterized protein n=1 Tax=Periconia macrospinosa TaxID=97972 RepID=A0A2V1DYG9_9PLEO|nr:hypothetical protein DM02DRAFT_258571 [Periconia macrospinosa]